MQSDGTTVERTTNRSTGRYLRVLGAFYGKKLLDYLVNGQFRLFPLLSSFTIAITRNVSSARSCRQRPAIHRRHNQLMYLTTVVIVQESKRGRAYFMQCENNPGLLKWFLNLGFFSFFFYKNLKNSKVRNLGFRLFFHLCN